MVRKIFFGIAIFMLSILFTNSISAASIDIDYDAELSKVCKPSHCLIPIPTLLDPQEKIIKINENFYLTGLTWNNTKVDIYVDDLYQGPATVIKDADSDTANFFYLIEDNSLLEGIHNWKVIAWAETMRKRSYVSAENNFVIESYFIAPRLSNITEDIDNNNWIIGETENNSLVSIYVDNVYQGQIRSDGNFNYNIGPLSPGLHTFYALAQEVGTGKTSKRSNILSEEVMIRDFEQSREEMIEESEIIDQDSEIEALEEVVEPIIEPEADIIEEVEVLEENISSISEEKSSDDELNIQSEDTTTNVSVTETNNSDVEVDVINEEESQDQLVVESQINELEDKEEAEITETEELQPATPSIEEKELMMEEIGIVEKQERNRKVGLFLLVILVVIVLASTFISGKKDKRSSKDSKKDENDNSHQGNLFNEE
jgi:hypothetical protein